MKEYGGKRGLPELPKMPAYDVRERTPERNGWNPQQEERERPGARTYAAPELSSFHSTPKMTMTERMLYEQMQMLSAQFESLKGTPVAPAKPITVERAGNVFYRIDPQTRETTNEIVEEIDLREKLFMDDHLTDLYLYVEELNTVSSAKFKDKSLQKKTETLDKKSVKEWNSKTCNSLIQHLYVDFHQIALSCNFDMYCIAYFVDRNFMHGANRNKVRQVVRENCREYVQNQRCLDAEAKGEYEIPANKKPHIEKVVLTEYNLKNIVYFAIAQAITPNFKSLNYPGWQQTKGEGLMEFFEKILGIYKMKVNTNRNGIRATEKREALEAMIRTLYQNGNREICRFIELSEKLDFFRAGYENDIPMKEIGKHLHVAEVRLSQDRDNTSIRSQYCSFSIQERETRGDNVHEVCQNHERETGERESVYGEGDEHVYFQRRGFSDRKDGKFTNSRTRVGARNGTQFDRNGSRNRFERKASPENRREAFKRVNDRFPQERQSYNRKNIPTRFRRRGKFFRGQFKTRFQQALAQLCKDHFGDSGDESEQESFFEAAQIRYDEGYLVDNDPEDPAEVEELELGEINMMTLAIDTEEKEDNACYFVPKRMSDLLYCQAKFALKKFEAMKCLMDSGSSVNLVRKDAVEAIGATRYIRKPEKPYSVYGFNDVKTTIYEEIMLELAVGPVKIKTIFYIVPNNVMKSQKVILGKPALLKLGFWQICERFMRERLKQ